MYKKDITGFFVLIYIVIMLIGGIGWCMNVYKLIKCDFKPSYKAEIIRGVSCFVFPAGAIAGYINIKDGD